MFDFFKSLFKPPAASGETAKERLRLVLLSDHLSLAPDVVESLKRDLMEVISRYVEIDSANADVTFEHREREIAMLANIPITGVRERKRPVAPERPIVPPVKSRPMPLPGVDAAVAMEPSTTEPSTTDGAEAPPVQTGAAAEVVTTTLATEAVHDVPVSSEPEKPESKPKRKPPAAEIQTPVRASNAAAPRRRRRKKYSAAAAAAAANAKLGAQGALGQQASAKG